MQHDSAPPSPLRRVHLTDERLPDGCTIINDRVRGCMIAVFDRAALHADPEAVLAEFEVHWETMARAYRPVRDALSSAS